MASKKMGQQTVVFDHPPSILGRGAVGGKREGEGPLGAAFDLIDSDDTFGQESWEKAESTMQRLALDYGLDSAHLTEDDLDLVVAGDLLNQCIASSFAMRDRNVSLLGLYGACSTMAEGLALGGMLLDGGFVDRIAAVASSHFCAAERQYRTPLEYGGQRTPTAQWTVTGSGAFVLGREGGAPYLTHATIGKIQDLGIKDANNMGAAMAPAAYDTIKTHLQDTGRSASDYDCIFTGDLGRLGRELVLDFFQKDGITLTNLEDCGCLIFDPKQQDVHCGGSGCGCSAVVLAGHLLNEMDRGTWNRILFCGTGALLSPTSAMQGESIPGICHAVAISRTKEG